eukprot:273610_1
MQNMNACEENTQNSAKRNKKIETKGTKKSKQYGPQRQVFAALDCPLYAASAVFAAASDTGYNSTHSSHTDCNSSLHIDYNSTHSSDYTPSKAPVAAVEYSEQVLSSE